MLQYYAGVKDTAKYLIQASLYFDHLAAEFNIVSNENIH
jgi:hypothetical protein